MPCDGILHWFPVATQRHPEKMPDLLLTQPPTPRHTHTEEMESVTAVSRVQHEGCLIIIIHVKTLVSFSAVSVE